MVHSDGGTRTDKHSAAAWQLEAYLPNGTVIVAAMAGVFIPDPCFAFSAESIALDEASTALARLVRSWQFP